MDLLVPDIPRSLELKIKAEQYQAQRELDRIEALKRRDDDSEDDLESGEEPLWRKSLSLVCRIEVTNRYLC